MANFLGVDVDALHTLAGHLNNRAEEIENLMNTLRSQLDDVKWIGPDGERFRGDWHNTHGPQLQAVATALRGASTAATRNAHEQEQASNS